MSCGWSEIPITNNEILERLEKDKKRGFLSFAWRGMGNITCKK
jgi:hypothetical protein